MTFDILIIGNGVLGLSTAFALSLEDPTARIGIVGPLNSAGGASIAAGAMLGCFGEVTHTTHKSEYGLEKLDLAARASKLWPNWIKKINSSLEKANQVFSNDGTFIILNTSSGSLDDKNFDAINKALQMYNEDHELVNPRDIPGMNPVESCRPLKALFIPNEGFINANRLLNALYKAILNRKNIKFIDDKAIKITTSFSKIDSIATTSGMVINANKFLLAAGAYSQLLLDQIPPLQFRIPRILYGSGSSLILKQDGHHKFTNVVRSPNRAGACGAHIVPYDSSTLYMGASNNIRLDEKTFPKARDMYYLIERAIEQFNQNLHKAEIIKYQTGNRPVTVDSYPLVGRTPVENLWLLTGTYRDGIHTSPLYAQFIAQDMLELPTSLKNKFLPSRKPLQTTNKEQAIEDFIEHCMCAAHEHSIRLPKVGWTNWFEDWWRMRGELLYNKLDVDIGLSPDLLIMLDQEPDAITKLKNYYAGINIYYSERAKPFLESAPKVKVAS